MAASKIYLNVPYVEKDEAKALGARWDSSNKKWYVTGNMDIVPFAKWQSDTVSSTVTNKPRSRTNSLSANNETGGVITYSTIKDFVAYNGDEPPWE